MAEQFLSAGKAARFLGVDRKHLRSLMARGDLPTYVDPLDRRKVLIRRADLERLHEPRPRPLPSGAPALA